MQGVEPMFSGERRWTSTPAWPKEARKEGRHTGFYSAGYLMVSFHGKHSLHIRSSHSQEPLGVKDDNNSNNNHNEVIIQ
jgi:hypothetical protein